MQHLLPTVATAAALRLPTGTGEHLEGGSAWAWLGTGEAWRSSRYPSPTAHSDSTLRPPMLDGELLRDRRIAASLSIRAVTKRTGIPAQTLRALEAGRQAADRQLTWQALSASPGCSTWIPASCSSTQRASPPGIPRLAASSPRTGRAGIGTW